jgi:primosomal protein N' (replication factor Y)
VEVLVDCPGAQGLFTYRVPPNLVIQPGDILTVPFGPQQVGAIAIRCIHQFPQGLDPDQVRSVQAIAHAGFFPVTYWSLLERVSVYYHTPLMAVIRVALPPGLLARSQRRIRLVEREKSKEKQDERSETKEAGSQGLGVSLHGDRDSLNQENILDDSPHPQSASDCLTRSQEPSHDRPSPCVSAPPTLSPAAQHLLSLLQASKTGDYSWQYLQRQVRGAHRGLHALVQAGWVESYLEPPSPLRAKQRQAVILTAAPPPDVDLSARQREILAVLQRQGGEIWLADLLQQCHTSSTTVKGLVEKGQVTIQSREVLRTEQTGAIAADAPKPLTPDQLAALAQISALSGGAQVLLHGVTGSGKTEVYLQAIAPVLQRGQTALVLVPEIGLTPQITDRFRARFGSQVCVYHSALSDGERYDTWRQLLNGQFQVVIGTRSAVFVPLPNLGLLILDEEHDPSFKQDQPMPCYHARTVAQWRSELENCPLILGTATPSLETWLRSQQESGEWGVGFRRERQPNGSGEWSKNAEDRNRETESHSPPFSPSPPSPLPAPHSPAPSPTLYLSLPTRIQARPLPPIQVVDMRQELQIGNRSIFSRSLQQAIQALQREGQQGILFIHRRGHSTFVSCRSCGHVVTCPHCDVSLTYHQPHSQARPTLRCHYCNYLQPQPDRCPACDSHYFKQFGSGTQRVTQELTHRFPDLRVIRFDSDTTRTKGAHRSLLSRFAAGEADLLVGTQMLTKGIDVPQVTLVGIVAADGLLHFADYRASERTFQVLTQVAGRCGRGDRPGRVILQTYSPEHPVIHAVQHYAYPTFVAAELAERQALGYPPYGQLMLFRFSSFSASAVQQGAEQVAAALASLQATGIELLGPSPAAILRVADRYRWQLLLKIPSQQDLPLLDLDGLRSLCPSTVSLTIDVDPLTIG